MKNSIKIFLILPTFFIALNKCSGSANHVVRKDKFIIE